MAAATDIGFVRMRGSKAVGQAPRAGELLWSQFVVLDELDGDRHLVIRIGQADFANPDMCDELLRSA
jgi:hypothetical protein